MYLNRRRICTRALKTKQKIIVIGDNVKVQMGTNGIEQGTNGKYLCLKVIMFVSFTPVLQNSIQIYV